MQFVKCILIPYCSSPTCFGPTHDDHQSALQNANKTQNKIFFIVVPCLLITLNFFSPTNAPFY